VKLLGASLAALLATAAVSCGGDSSSKSQRGEVELGSTNTTSPKREPARHPKKGGAKPGSSVRAARPTITQKPIPFPAKRVEETAAYGQRHYGTASSELDPKVIVEHYTETSTAQAAYDIFAKDVPDVELHEVPGVCSHFIIDRDGTILQLVPLRLRCRHTVGLNDVAIGMEHVGMSDSDVLDNAKELDASLRLSTWLRCRYGISISNVIGHAESLSSPYHHEGVASLKRQTHSDLQPASMERYRSRLAKRRC
jgi:N-acetylmuramoyl-L-alanine amidase